MEVYMYLKRISDKFSVFSNSSDSFPEKGSTKYYKRYNFVRLFIQSTIAHTKSQCDIRWLITDDKTDEAFHVI